MEHNENDTPLLALLIVAAIVAACDLLDRLNLRRRRTR